MSSLNDQLNSFRKKVRNAPTIQKPIVSKVTAVESRKRTPSSSTPEPTTAKKLKRPNIVYSQPAATGVGNHQSTQLVHAVEYIKKQDRAVRFSDIESYLNFPIGPLLVLMRSIDRIKVNEKDQTAEYVSVYNIYNADDLLTFLRSQETYQGVPVKNLKDGWNGCLEAIDKLEKGQDIVVLRTKKENAPRYVWANVGGPIGGIDGSFLKLWTESKVPASSELPGQLEKLGLKPTSVDPATVKKTSKQADERKQKKPRRGKITNTHLRGVLKDYGL
jgi:transcription initiation factor TFIIE subunit beta